MRDSIIWIALLGAGAVLGVACAAPVAENRRVDADVDEPAVRHATHATGNSHRVIGVIQLRDERMAILATPGGVRFSVGAAKGALGHGELTLAELQRRHELLYRVYRSGYASDEPFLDARVDHELVDTPER